MSEFNLFSLHGAEADADLSAKQFYCVKQSTTDRRVSLCTVEGEPFIGVLQDKPSAAGDPAEVRVAGITKGKAGVALTAGDYWGTKADGKVIPISVGLTGQDIGQYVAGQVLVGCAADEIGCELTIGFLGFRVPSV